MSKLVAFALVALAALSVVSAAPIFPRQTVSSGWDSETQQGYNTRFLALDCQNQQNTQFFDDCCRPLKQGQALGDNCSNLSPTLSGSPSNTLMSDPPSTQTPEPIFVRDTSGDCEDDDTCDEEEEDCDPSSSPVNEPSLTPTSVSPPYKTHSPTLTPTLSPEPSPSSSTDNATPTSTPANPETHTGGHVTWFTQDGNAGACGTVHSDSDFIVALDSDTYGDTSAQSPYCGKMIRISWQGKSVDALVADACPTCYNAASVDLSQAAFEALASLDVGELEDASWTLL